jgi:hypothetical protein
LISRQCKAEKSGSYVHIGTGALPEDNAEQTKGRCEIK